MSSSRVQKAISGSIIQNSARCRLVWLSAHMPQGSVTITDKQQQSQQKCVHALEDFKEFSLYVRSVGKGFVGFKIY